MRDGWVTVALGDVLDLDVQQERVESTATYEMAGVYSFGRGLFRRDALKGADTTYVKLNRLRSKQIVMSKLKAWEGALAVVPDSFEGSYLSPEFPTFTARPEVDHRYLGLMVTGETFWKRLVDESTGMGGRRERVHPTRLLGVSVDLPPLVVQRRVVDLVDAVDTYAAATTDQVKVAEASLGALRRMLIDESDAPLVDFSEVATIESALVDPTLPGYRDLPHLGVDRIQSRTGRLVGVQTAADDGVTSGKFLFTEEDVIYSKIRPELRKAAFPRYEGLCSADAYPLRPTPGVDPHYLLELLLSDVFGDEAIGRSSRTKMPKINRRELADIRVPCPDPDEQRQIGELLHSVRVMRDAAAALGETLATIRSGLLGELLSGDREIPGSYDELVGLVA